MTPRYSRARFATVAVAFTLAFLTLVGRFAWIQLVRSDHWRERARVRSTDMVEEPARRGRLLDREGRVLAASEEWTTVGVSRPKSWRKDGDVEALADLLDRPVRAIVKRVNRNVDHAVLGEFRIDDRTRRALRRVAPVTFDRRARRVQPDDEVAAALLGIVQKSGEGASGLERAYDEVLAGLPGRVLERRDGRQVILDRRMVDPPRHGADLVLSLDLHLQRIAERELRRAVVDAEARGGQALVLEPATGDVLALAQFSHGPQEEGLGPWRVMAATDVFEPGSVFKLFSGASLLARGVADTATVFDGTRESKTQRRVTKEFPGGYTIRDVHPVGRVSLRHAFTRSSNIIFATAALELLRRRELYQDLRAFGFGEYPGVGFPGETAGILRSPEHPLWSERTQSTLAIGQEVGVSLLQLGTAAAAVLGDGSLRRPRFVREIRHADGRVEIVDPVVRRRGVAGPDVIAALRAMGTDVVSAAYGTGKLARVDGLEVGGKTGTAQVTSPDGGYEKGVYTPTFVGFAPARDPRIVVVIVLHRAPGRLASGGTLAAPVFASIVREIAASTTLLDAHVARSVDTPSTMPAPELRGRSVAELRELASRVPWGSGLGTLPASGVVIGQIPPAGTPMRTDARVQLAFGPEVRP